MSRHSWVREGSMGIWEADQSLTPNHPPRGRMLHSIVFLFTNIFLFFCHFARRYYSLVIISKCFKSGFHSWKLLICSDIFRSNTFWHKVNKVTLKTLLTHSLLTDRGLQVLWQAIASEKGVADKMRRVVPPVQGTVWIPRVQSIHPTCPACLSDTKRQNGY